MLAARDLQQNRSFIRTRRVLAFPIYVVAFIVEFFGGFLGWLAAKIAGDA